MSAGLASSDADAVRVCPVLAGPGLLRGRTLSLRTPLALREVTAPARYLRPLHDWCDGQRSLAELASMARRAWGETDARRWMHFVGDLLSAGLLVDAACVLPAASAYARHPSPWGYALPRAQWPAIVQVLAVPAKAGDPVGTGRAQTAVPTLAGLLARRCSARGFDVQGQADPRAIDALCWALAGRASDDGRRTHPSAGGLYPLRVRVIILRACDGWSEGVHAVGLDARGRLVRDQVAPLSPQWMRAFIQPHRVTGASGVVVLSVDLGPPALKYRNRSYPYALIEAGTVLQNGALACAETGLGFHVLGGYDDQVLGAQCGLPPGEQVIAGALFGCARAVAPEVLAFDFRWATTDPALPFHVARIELADPAGQGASGWGRDTDPRLAAARALGEAVERLAWRRPAQLQEARAQDLGRVVPPGALVAYSRGQHASPAFPFERFDAARRRLWTVVARAGDDASHWVPAEFVFHADALPPSPTGRRLTRSNSSGCASHPDVAQARANALFELVERDAFMRHWLGQRPAQPLGLADWPEALVLRARRLAADGCEASVGVLDGEFPVWLVGIRCHAGGFFSIGAATGCDPGEALRRAFDEAETAARTRMGEPASAVSVASVHRARDHADLFAQRRHYRRAQVLFADGVAFDGWQRWPASFEQALDRLGARGREVFFADLSQADAPPGFDGRPLHTVRALVPGLVPIVFGQAPLPLGMLRAAPGGRFPHPFP